MNPAQQLLAAQNDHFAMLDPLLPNAVAPIDGELITAALPDGRRVAGMVVSTSYPATSVARLWSAAQVQELMPLTGSTGGGGMDALLRTWRQLLDHGAVPVADSSCVVTWPSRDVLATRALLDHGFAPLSSIAVRQAGPGLAAPDRTGLSTVTVRLATPRDLDLVLELAMVELEYSAMVGSTVLRPEAVELKRDALGRRLAGGDPVWLAERDDVAVGLAECGWLDSTPYSWPAPRVRPGRWGYVNCTSVLPAARGTGVGQQLMAVVHGELRHAGATGTYLYYNPPNPLSSVFWIRQGYRPLWTIWEVRPASALR